MSEDYQSVCELPDHPYHSPSEDSENDDLLEDMNFSLFTMEKTMSLSAEAENQIDESSNLEESNSVVTDDSEPTVGGPMMDHSDSLEWCNCGQCSQCPQREAVCCHDEPEILDLIKSDGGCITNEHFFEFQLMCEEGLHYNRLIYASLIKDNSARQKYLDKSFDNGMKRHLCYRNFLAVVNRGQPLGRGVRVILPRCVISKIRQQYPDNNGLYTGFQPAHDHD